MLIHLFWMYQFCSHSKCKQNTSRASNIQGFWQVTASSRWHTLAPPLQRQNWSSVRSSWLHGVYTKIYKVQAPPHVPESTLQIPTACVGEMFPGRSNIIANLWEAINPFAEDYRKPQSHAIQVATNWWTLLPLSWNHLHPEDHNCIKPNKLTCDAWLSESSKDFPVFLFQLRSEKMNKVPTGCLSRIQGDLQSIPGSDNVLKKGSSKIPVTITYHHPCSAFREKEW